MDNADWYAGRNVIEFLSTAGRRARVSKLLELESVRSRMLADKAARALDSGRQGAGAAADARSSAAPVPAQGDGMSVGEFLYALLQANDFLELHRTRGCSVQIGGHDQTGNIDMGIDLLQRTRRQHVYGLTVPLLLDSRGVLISQVTNSVTSQGSPESGAGGAQSDTRTWRSRRQ